MNPPTGRTRLSLGSLGFHILRLRNGSPICGTKFHDFGVREVGDFSQEEQLIEAEAGRAFPCAILVGIATIEGSGCARRSPVQWTF